jgi:hypothetical protein
MRVVAVLSILIAVFGCDESRRRPGGSSGRTGRDATERTDDASELSDGGASLDDASEASDLGFGSFDRGFADASFGSDRGFLDAFFFDATGGRDAEGGFDAQAPSGMPEAWWRFEETSGPVIDSSGNGHHGTATGVGRGLAGRFGSAMTFNGTGQVIVPADPGLDFITAGTIELWIRLDTYPDVGSTVSRGTGNNDDNVLMNTSCGNMQTIFSRRSSGTTNVTSGCERIPPGVWTHIAVVNDGSSLILYINGVLDSTAQGGYLGPLSTQLYIGQREQGIFALVGSLDEIKWWTVARSQAEVCADAGGSWTGTTCVL